MNEPLSKLKHLPLEDPRVYQMISSNLNLMNEIKELFHEKISTIQLNESKSKAKLSNILGNYGVFRNALEELGKKLLPKCKTLLLINLEYLQTTIT